MQSFAAAGTVLFSSNPIAGAGIESSKAPLLLLVEDYTLRLYYVADPILAAQVHS
jgi:hypothetical protein